MVQASARHLFLLVVQKYIELRFVIALVGVRLEKIYILLHQHHLLHHLHLNTHAIINHQYDTIKLPIKLKIYDKIIIIYYFIMSNPKKFLGTSNDVVCENKPEERVALALPTTQIAEAADQLIENCTADNMYSVYKIMDCEDKYTNASQKVFLAAATAQPYLLR
jgi:hypothetical protein